MAAPVVKADIGCLIGSQAVLADLVDIGGGVTVFQLKTGMSGAGGGPVTVADGADVAEGAIADAMAAVGGIGTLSAKLRRITQGLEDLKTMITIAGTVGALTDHSGTTPDLLDNIVVIANATRKYLLIQNLSADDFWINFGAVAVTSQPSFKMSSDSVLIFESNFITNQAIHLIATVAAQDYCIKEG